VREGGGDRVSATVILPGALRSLAGDRPALEVTGEPKTVREVFADVRASHPAVWDRVFTEQGELRPHVNVFVGRDDIRWSGGMDTPVSAGAEVTILPAVSGG
jgi:molybdopterin converting factor small subunit